MDFNKLKELILLTRDVPLKVQTDQISDAKLN